MKLYHYTSIETLALILKHKTIRFSRLDRVDDPLSQVMVLLQLIIVSFHVGRKIAERIFLSGICMEIPRMVCASSWIQICLNFMEIECVQIS